MGDPVTMAMIGGTIGAATSKDPLKGAMLGAAGGYAGGSLFNTGSMVGTGASGFPISSELGGDAILGSEALGGAWKDIQAVNAWMNQNPATAKIGMQLAGNLLSPEQQRMQPIGASVRPGGQVAPVDYMSLLNPQNQTVIRPATPSLI